jgi:hypothetical protein
MQLDTNLLQHGTINNVSSCCTLAQPISFNVLGLLLLHHIIVYCCTILPSTLLACHAEASGIERYNKTIAPAAAHPLDKESSCRVLEILAALLSQHSA